MHLAPFCKRSGGPIRGVDQEPFGTRPFRLRQAVRKAVEFGGVGFFALPRDVAVVETPGLMPQAILTNIVTRIPIGIM